MTSADLRNILQRYPIFTLILSVCCALLFIQRQRYWGNTNACDNDAKWLYWRIL